MERCFLTLIGFAVLAALAENATAGERDAIEKWQERAALREPKQIFVNVTFSPDGKILATASMAGGLVTLWDVAHHELRTTLKTGHRGPISLAFSRDSKLIASLGSDAEVKLWDVGTGKQKRSISVIPKNQERIVVKGVVTGGHCQLAFSPDGKLLVTACRNVVTIWDLGTGKAQATLEGHSDRVVTLAFALGGKVLITGSADGTVKVWNVAMANERASFEGSPDGHVAVSGDGKTLAVSNSQGDVTNIMLWDLEAGKEKATWKEIEAAGRIRLALSPDGKTLATSRREVRLWDVVSRKELVAFKRQGAQPAMALSFSPDGKILAASSCEIELPSEDFTGLLNLWELCPIGK
jgi:WD40 repeat protein